ncbi:MAG: hypothetical protein JOZ78_05340 [Chroococcidiopsidaceae cyanobacterium CP_BM_ER_R8_30]|nr:hypothetical protein [Chroococcidiopsidaceae cyanobacterium CP_BM_ER_R8_30]
MMEDTSLMELLQSKDYGKILSVYQKQPLNAIAVAADSLRQGEIYNVAIALYQYLLEQKEDAKFYYGIGQCYGKLYNYERSLLYLDKAFNLEKDRTEGANYYAYILERNFLMDRAYEWYQKALNKGYENDLWTLSHYAYFLEKYNKKVEAKQTYEDVLDRNSAYTWAVKRYAIFLLKENEPEQSMKLMQEALDKHPNNPFVKLNYLEYLIIREMTDEYEEYLHNIRYEKSPLPFQVLIDLFDYFFRYLLNDNSEILKVKAYEEKAKQLPDSIHRDFDELDEMLIAKNGDMTEWKRLIQFLVK